MSRMKWELNRSHLSTAMGQVLCYPEALARSLDVDSLDI